MVKQKEANEADIEKEKEIEKDKEKDNDIEKDIDTEQSGQQLSLFNIE